MNKLKKIEKYSLSQSDIYKVFKPKTINIILYEDLNKYETIDEIFKGSSFNHCVMFFPENKQENNGHWTCIIKHLNNTYEYFDSYKNYPPDSERKWLSKQLIDELHLQQPLLKDLFNRSGVKSVIFNHLPFQAMKPNIDDCGRHACCRLLNSNLTITQYWNMIKKSKWKNPDEYVSFTIYEIIGK